MNNSKSIITIQGLLYDETIIMAAMRDIVAATLAVIAPREAADWNRFGWLIMQQCTDSLPRGVNATNVCQKLSIGRLTAACYPFGQEKLKLNTDLKTFVSEYGDTVANLDPAPAMTIGEPGMGTSVTGRCLTESEAAAVVAAIEALGLGVEVRTFGTICHVVEGGVASAERGGLFIAVAFPHSIYGIGQGELRMPWDGTCVGRTNLVSTTIRA